MDAESLDRFVAAQDTIYPRALAELKAGMKRNHWMWFVFPQLAGLGRSETSRYYAIEGVHEAQAYLAHPLLGTRLAECTDAMLGWTGKRGAEAILGPVDALKFKSSMTLFEAAGGGERFARALDGFHAGERDPATLNLLKRR